MRDAASLEEEGRNVGASWNPTRRIIAVAVRFSFIFLFFLLLFLLYTSLYDSDMVIIIICCRRPMVMSYFLAFT